MSWLQLLVYNRIWAVPYWISPLGWVTISNRMLTDIVENIFRHGLISRYIWVLVYPDKIRRLWDFISPWVQDMKNIVLLMMIWLNNLSMETFLEFQSYEPWIGHLL